MTSSHEETVDCTLALHHAKNACPKLTSNPQRKGPYEAHRMLFYLQELASKEKLQISTTTSIKSRRCRRWLKRAMPTFDDSLWKLNRLTISSNKPQDSPTAAWQGQKGISISDAWWCVADDQKHKQPSPKELEKIVVVSRAKYGKHQSRARGEKFTENGLQRTNRKSVVFGLELKSQQKNPRNGCFGYHWRSHKCKWTRPEEIGKLNPIGKKAFEQSLSHAFIGK